MVNNWLNINQNCLLCRRSHKTGLPFCAECMADLPWLERGCPQCGLPTLETSVTPCGHCQAHPPWFDHCEALFHYQAPISTLVQQFKFRARLDILHRLGRIMARELLSCSGLVRPEAIVPVPLHSRRMRWRGYNQALELARPIARTLDLPMEPDLVQRIRPTREQSHLKPTERRRNIKHAFNLTRSVAYRHVAIIDDVVTTAHTVNEISRILKLGGVKQITIWCLCRAGRQ